MRIKHFILLMFCLTGLGCTASHFRSLPLAVNQVVAQDSVKRLVSLYPPARTRFYLKPSARNQFNLQLNQCLRQTGYSINEFRADEINSQGIQSLALQAYVDEPIKGSLYRVTLIIRHQSLSRAYQLKKGVIRPLGLWVRKESSQ